MTTVPLLRIALCLSLALPAFAQTPAKVLTLEECVKLAVAAPSQISVARLETEAALSGIAQARASFLPQAGLNTGFVHNTSASFVALNGTREWIALAGGSVEFDSSGRLRAELNRARAAHQAATASVAITQRDLKRAVTTSYYRVLLTRRLAVVAKMLLADSENFEARTKKLYEGGEAARADVVKAAAQSSQFRQALSAAELEAKIANQELASFWTRDVTDELAIEDILDKPLPTPEAEAAAAAPFMNRIEFNLLDAQRRGLQAEARRELAAMRPVATMDFRFGIDSNILSLRDRGASTTIGVNIPLFDWHKAREASNAFLARAKQVDANRAIAERALSKEYQAALVRVKQYYAQVAMTSDAQKLAEEDLKLSRLRYEGGEGSALDVVTSQSQLAQARSTYFANLTNYLNARADLEVAAGR